VQKSLAGCRFRGMKLIFASDDERPLPPVGPGPLQYAAPARPLRPRVDNLPELSRNRSARQNPAATDRATSRPVAESIPGAVTLQVFH